MWTIELLKLRLVNRAQSTTLCLCQLEVQRRFKVFVLLISFINGDIDALRKPKPS